MINIINKFQKLDKYTKIAIVLILIGVIIRVSIVPFTTVSGDGCWHISISNFIVENGRTPLHEMLGRPEAFSRPPLFHLFNALLYSVFKLIGPSAASLAIKYTSTIFGSLSLVLVFLIAKKMFNKKIATYSLFFVTFLPMHIYFSSITHIDVLVSFLVLAAIYFVIENRIVLSGIFLGFALLSKYESVICLVVIAAILLIKHKDRITLFFKNTLIVCGIGLIMSAGWYIRNYIHLKNPIWPFLSNIIGGTSGLKVCDAGGSIYNILNIGQILERLQLGFFGVPNGSFSSFSFYNIPYLEYMIAIWFIGTLIYIFPFIYGIFKLDYKNKNTFILGVWILAYILVDLIFLASCGNFLARYLMSSIPVFAIIAGVGVNSLFEKRKTNNIKRIFIILIIIIAAAFVTIEFGKAVMATKSWDFYSQDFDWVKQNTKKSDMFFGEGQCLAYHMNRYTYQEDDRLKYKAFEENLAYNKNISYVWVNQKFKLDPNEILDPSIAKIFEEQNSKYVKIYENNKTNTIIYKVKR